MGRYGAMIQIGEKMMRKKLTLRLCQPKYFYHYFRRSFRFIQIPFDLKNLKENQFL
jgi:hypothetical protein